MLYDNTMSGLFQTQLLLLEHFWWKLHQSTQEILSLQSSFWVEGLFFFFTLEGQTAKWSILTQHSGTLLMSTGAPERTKGAALNFYSKAAFSEKLGVGADTGIFIISLCACGFKVVMLTWISQNFREQFNERHASVSSDFSERTIA